MKPILDHELHLHLYGCLTAEDVWELGKEARKDSERLDWYCREYEKSFGYRPDWRSYWNSVTGIESLRKDYEFRKPGSFAQFQAKFNLLIALFPLTPHRSDILEHVMQRHRNEGLQYAEYRLILPPHFTKSQLSEFLESQARTIMQFENASSGKFTPRMALSLPRDNETATRLYRFLHQWLLENPKSARAITAVDFCFFEEGFPPKDKRRLFKEILVNNQKHPKSALAILYHVGESFDTMSLASSIRWVWQAHRLGAHRLGHAISLGVNPKILEGQTICEPIAEHYDHLNWLIDHHELLKSGGYDPGIRELKTRLDYVSTLNQPTLSFTYTYELIAELNKLQEAIISLLKDESAVIECCPTSNLRIGRIRSTHDHPFKRFWHADLPVILSTDDPGIFGVRLRDEQIFCQKSFNLTDEDFDKLNKNAKAAKSELLTRV